MADQPDFGSLLGGALAGGAAGLAPVGIAAALLGQFGKKKKQFSYQNYTDPRIAGVMDRLINGQVGAQNAALAAGSIRNQAREQYDQAENNPSFSNNAAVQTSFYNQAQNNAEQGIAGAFAQGAQIDSANMARGAEIGQREQEYSLQRNQLQAQFDEANNQPGFLEQLLGQGASTLSGSIFGGAGTAAGAGFGKLINPGYDPNAGMNQDHSGGSGGGYNFNSNTPGYNGNKSFQWNW